MQTKTKPDKFTITEDTLKDKVILITGASGSFGKAMSKAYSNAGATVILLGKNVRLLENLYDEIEQAGGPTPAIYPLNLQGATEKDYYDMAQTIENEFGQLDGILHAAAMLGTPTPFEHSDSENWYQVMQVNLHGPYMLTKACIPVLKKSSHASLLFMTDDKFGAYWDAYAISKAGINGLMQTLSAEYADSNLYVNCVNPGPTKTPIQLIAFPGSTESNNALPLAADRSDLFVYLMSNQMKENGICFVSESNE